MPTRGQVKRALDWLDFLAVPRLKRARDSFPRCVTCGSASTHEFARGEPAYGCNHDDPITLDPETIARARLELARPAPALRRKGERV